MVIKYPVKAQSFPTNYYLKVFDKSLNLDKVHQCLMNQLVDVHDELLNSIKIKKKLIILNNYINKKSILTHKACLDRTRLLKQ